MINAALVQTEANIISKEKTLEEIEQYFLVNKDIKYDLICFPELFASKINLGNLDDVAEKEDGYTFVFLSELAKERNSYVVGGILEKEDDNYFNTALFIDNRGCLLGKHRKICLNEFENLFLEPGQEIGLFDTSIGKIGIAVGNDINALGLCNNYAVQEADILICITQVPFEYSFAIKTVALSRVVDIPTYLLIASICGTSNVSRINFTGMTAVLYNSNLLEDKIACEDEDYILKKMDENNIGILEVKIDTDKLRSERADSTTKINHKYINLLI